MDCKAVMLLLGTYFLKSRELGREISPWGPVASELESQGYIDRQHRGCMHTLRIGMSLGNIKSIYCLQADYNNVQKTVSLIKLRL